MKVRTTGTVVALADGTVPVTVQCLISVSCRGALLLMADNLVEGPLGRYNDSIELGRSDLEIGAHGTTTFAIPLSSEGVQRLRSRGTVGARVTADVLRLVPPCQQIPDLAAQCQRYVERPDYRPDDGDGIDRLAEGTFQLTAPSAAP